MPVCTLQGRYAPGSFTTGLGAFRFAPRTYTDYDSLLLLLVQVVRASCIEGGLLLPVPIYLGLG